MHRSLIHKFTLVVLFAFLAMSFMIVATTNCPKSSKNIQGPFCSVQHTSLPTHTTKSAPDIALISEFAALLMAIIAIKAYAELVFQKSLIRFTGIIGRVSRNNHVRSRSGPIPFDQFLPQIACSHGF